MKGGDADKREDCRDFMSATPFFVLAFVRSPGERSDTRDVTRKDPGYRCAHPGYQTCFASLSIRFAKNIPLYRNSDLSYVSPIPAHS